MHHVAITARDWSDAIIKHVVQTGHVGLLSYDRPGTHDFFGATCAVHGCGHSFGIEGYLLRLDSSEYGQTTWQSVQYPEGLKPFIEWLVRLGLETRRTKRARPPERPIVRTTCWARLLKPNED